MSLIIVNEAMQSKFAAAESPMEVCSEDGQILGYFTPAKAGKKLKLDPGISVEEMQRRVDAGGGRTLPEIMRDLEARA